MTRIALWSCVTLLLAAGPRVHAQCDDAARPRVELRGDAAYGGVPLAAIVAALAVGLARSGIALCTAPPRLASAAPAIARVEIVAAAGRGSFRITVHDDVTHKLVERQVELAAVPEDSRAIALAVYVEELLDASWAELALAHQAHPHAAPVALRAHVSRAIADDAVPPTAAGPLRVFAGGVAAAYGGGLTQAGVQLGAGLRLATWLGASLRASYAWSPSVRALHGRVDAQALGAGLYLEPILQVSQAVGLRLPQGVDVSRVSFRAQPDRGARSRPAARTAVVVSHGIGPVFALAPRLALTLLVRLCWTWLPARASDAGSIATGLSGIGGQLEVLFDVAF